MTVFLQIAPLGLLIAVSGWLVFRGLDRIKPDKTHKRNIGGGPLRPL